MQIHSRVCRTEEGGNNDAQISEYMRESEIFSNQML